ncbi:hypothetical protein [Halanaerobaculum tunisiense]
MFLPDKLTELSIGMVNKELEEVKESDPEEYEETIKMLLLMTEIATHFLQESQEFREAFAKIHTEFLKRPERKQVIEEAITAYADFKEETK